MSKEPLIELIGVDVVHEDAPETVLVRDVQWRICEGEFWVVSADPGSGRTSLLATAAGLNRPGGGRLRIFGTDLSDASEQQQVEWRKKIGFVFETGGRLFSHLTVAENVALPLMYHSELNPAQAVARLDELLAMADLQGGAELMPSRLSLRFQQRVSLVRALATPKRVLFLDNPVGGMAVRESRWWFDFLRGIYERGKSGDQALTIVVSSDDFRGWLDLASDFAIIQGKQLRLLGGRDDLVATQEAELKDFLPNLN